MVDITASPVTVDFSFLGEWDYPGLVKLDYVKTLLGIDPSDTSQDAYLTSQIIWVSNRIEVYCARRFKADNGSLYLMRPAPGCDGHYTEWPVRWYRDKSRGCLYVDNFPIIATQSVVVDGVALTADQYDVDVASGRYVSCKFLEADFTINIAFRAGFDPVPPEVAQAAADLVVSRYYNQGSDPSRIVRSENVPDVASVSYVSSVFYQSGYDPILGQYGSVLDPYRTEKAMGFDAETDFADEVCW